MKTLFLILSLLGILSAPVVNAEDLFIEGDFAAAQKEARAAGKLVMIDFKAEWCGPCKMLDRTTWKDESVVSSVKGKAVAVKVDVDENGELASRYGIHSLPTVIFTDGNGNEVSRFIGYRDAEGFLKEFSKL